MENKFKILIVVDMQNDFIDGALGTKEAQAILPNVLCKIKEYQAEKDLIIFTRDTHSSQYLNSNEGKHLPIEHCIINSEGWKLNSQIEKLISEIKETSSSQNVQFVDKFTFGYKDWKTLFKIWDDGSNLEIELVGLCTDICVISNALILKANYPEATIKVDSKCCAGVTPETHQAALTSMKMCQIEIM